MQLKLSVPCNTIVQYLEFERSIPSQIICSKLWASVDGGYIHGQSLNCNLACWSFIEKTSMMQDPNPK